MEATNLNTTNVAISGKSDRWFTFVGEFAAGFDSESSEEDGTQFDGHARFMTVRGGPRFVSTANPKLRPFVHSLFGFTNSRVSLSAPSLSATTLHDSANDFSMALGGGADFKIASKLAIRAQMDYIHIGHLDLFDTDLGATNGFRFTTGLVFRFN